MFGAQPALAVGQRVASNIVEGRPATEGIEDAYGQGVVGTAIPVLGHKVVGSLLRTRVPAGNQEPNRSTLEKTIDESTRAEQLRARRSAQLRINSAAGRAWENVTEFRV